MFEKESNAWIQNNRFIEKLEIDLKIIELEKEKNAEHSILTNLIKERLGNIKFPVDYTLPLAFKIKKKHKY